MESLTNSCAPVHPLIDRGSVEQAVSNVAERSFFAYAEPAEAAAVADLTADGQPAMATTVHFTGPITGEMCVTMPLSLTRELAQLFSGDPDLDFTDADLTDMAGEFTNMVTGSWLTAADNRSMFDLSAPSVARIDAVPPVGMMMLINGQPVGLSWRVE